MVVMSMVMFSGERRHRCRQQHYTGQYGDERFLQSISSAEAYSCLHSVSSTFSPLSAML
jgi:hypothetical protein